MKSVYFKLILFSSVVFFSCGKNKNETKPEKKDITETVFASGTLEPENKYNLTAQTDGYILELRFDDGDTVKEGQVLALIDNKANAINAGSAESLLGLAGINASPEGPTLKQAEQNLRLLKDKAAQDSVQYNRYLKLATSNSVSKLELENTRLAYETSKTNYSNAGQNYKLLKQQTEQQLIAQRSLRDVNAVTRENNEIKAVVGGKVYKRMKEVGDFVRRGDVIAVIGDADKVYAKLGIDESNIFKIKLNQEAIVQLNVNPDKNYMGFVSEIYPAFDEATQSFYCKVGFKDRIDFKIAGTQLQANIVVESKKGALVIPKAYMIYGNKVLVKDKGEVQLKTGFVSGEWVEVLDGVDENAVIINDPTKH